MYCPNCGNQISDLAVICVNCGCAVNNNQTKVNPDDAPSTAWAVLGFFIPIVGLILYILNHDKTPLKAKSAIKGAIAGFVLSFIFSFVYFVFIGIGSSMYYYF